MTVEHIAAILVVDETGSAHDDIVDLLRGAKYDVSSATTFGDAKEALATRAYDLLITELRLGAFNGLQLVVCARSRHSIPAIVVTSFPDRALEIEAGRLCAGYFVKPLAALAFLNTVASALTDFGAPAYPSLPRA